MTAVAVEHQRACAPGSVPGGAPGTGSGGAATAPGASAGDGADAGALPPVDDMRRCFGGGGEEPGGSK
jgi:hypothetical protein